MNCVDWKKTLFRFAVINLLSLGTPFQGVARADTQAQSTAVPAPKGLSLCPADDSVVALETRVVASLGGEFLSCFRSEKRVAVPGVPELAPVPFEYAFAIRLAGGNYNSADLDKLLATVTAQWKDFKPLNGELPDDYIAHLNTFAKGAGETSATIASIKPVLVSIERLDAKSCLVVAIRSYVFNAGGRQISTRRVEAGAVVLLGRHLIRLDMQRTLTAASDVAQVQAEASEWIRAAERTDPGQ